MKHKIILLSIKPKYLNLIFSDKKKVELRRKLPDLKKGDLVVLYSSSPECAIVGAMLVDKKIEKSPECLWRQISKYAGISKDEFDDYFYDSEKAVALFFAGYEKLKIPIRLEDIRKKWPDFQPPQNYIYLTDIKNKSCINLNFHHLFDKILITPSKLLCVE